MMNGDLTAVHDWSKLTAQDQETMGKNWQQESNLESLQKSGQSIQNRACYEYSRRKAMQTSNLALTKQIDFLQIQLKLYQKVKHAQSINYNQTIQTITSLITKSNGEPLNNEMAQVLEMLQNSQKQISLDCKQIVKEYKNELQNHGIQDESWKWLTYDYSCDTNQKPTK